MKTRNCWATFNPCIKSLLCALLTTALHPNAQAACTPVPSGLIAWYQAEGNANDPVGSINGSLQGGATFAAGRVGQAFSLNSVNASVQIPDSSSLDFGSTSPMTIEFWAYRTGSQTTMYLLGKRQPSCGALQYEFEFDPFNGLTFNAGAGTVSTGKQMPLNQWMHLAVTFDGGTFKFYTNSVLAASASGNLGAANNAPLVIGNSSVCSAFFGLIDEVSIYDRALSASEVQAIYSAGTDGKCFTPPALTLEPKSVEALLGENLTLTAAATGSAPLNFQWKHEGTNLPGATSTSLTISNIQPSQSGNYSIVVSNLAAHATSSNALVTIKTPVPGHVVVNDQAGLAAALSGGGNVVFDSNGTVPMSSSITISQDTVLDGSGRTIVLDGGNSTRLFSVDPGIHFTLSNLTLINALHKGADGTPSVTAGSDGFGGVLYNNGGTVDILNCALRNNSAIGGTGYNGQTGGRALGGALYNDNSGNLNLTNTAFESNTAFAGNTLAPGLGGSIFNSNGAVNISGCAFTLNSSHGAFNGTTDGGDAFGGAIHSDLGDLLVSNTLFMSNSCSAGITISGNQAFIGTSCGGAISSSNSVVTVLGSSFGYNLAAPAINASINSTTSGKCDPSKGGAVCFSGSEIYVGNSSFTSNACLSVPIVGRNAAAAAGFGGAIYNDASLLCTNTVLRGNLVVGGTGGNPSGNGNGGALYNAATAVLRYASVFENAAVAGASSVAFDQGLASGSGYGGGIYNSNTLVLVNSTLASNITVGGTSPASYQRPIPGHGYGGAIFNIGSLNATNDTISANNAIGGSPGDPAFFPSGNAFGGGIMNSGGTAVVCNVTLAWNAGIALAANPAGLSIGGGIHATNGSLTIINSIISSNSVGGDFYNNFGSLTDGGHNLASDFSFTFSAPGSVNGVDPKLGALGSYGGPTMTIPLLAGSPAIDAGDCASSPATDQRGVPRPFGAACDIGAFELSLTISGTISGHIPPTGVSLTAGAFGTTSDSSGAFLFGAVTAGSYTVTPSAPGVVFVPSSRDVTVGPSAAGVNFTAFGTNTLSAAGSSNGNLHYLYTGSNGQSAITELSTNLVNWAPVATNSVGAGGMADVYFTNNIAYQSLFFRIRVQ